MKTTVSLLTATFLYIIVASDIKAQDFYFANGVGGPDQDEATDVTVDNQGNIYNTGYFSKSFDFDPSQDTAILEVEGESAIFISKYSPDGSLIWARAIQSYDGYSRGNCITVDDSCNIYAAGYVDKRTDFDPSDGELILNNNGIQNIYVAKYDSSCQLLWAFVITGCNKYDDVFSLRLDSANNVLISGFVQGSMDFDPGPGVAMLPASGITGYFAKYDSDGEYITSGSIIGAEIHGLTMDKNENLYLAGIFFGSVDLDMSAGEYTVNSNGDRDWFLAKYDKNYVLEWGFSIGNAQQDHIQKLILSPNDKIIASGFYNGSVQFDPDGQFENISSKGYSDIFIAEYDTNGSLSWIKSLGGSQPDDVKDIITDKEDKIVVTGTYQGAIDVDPGEDNIYLPTMGIEDAFIGQYDTSGNYLAAYSLRGPGVKVINAIYNDLSDNIVITGKYDNNLDFDLGNEVHVVPKNGLYGDVFLAKYKLNINEPGDTGQVVYNRDLVKDINPETGSNPSYLYAFDNKLYFTADDGTFGRELWVTDGTFLGTNMVMDINTFGDSFLEDPKFMNHNGDLYFIAQDSIHGNELWISGDVTRMVKDLNPSGNGLGNFSTLIVYDSVVYFTAKDSGTIDLWKSSGNESTTEKIYDFTMYGNGIISDLVVFKDHLYFFTEDSVHGAILWRSNGTENGTDIFLEFNDDAACDQSNELFPTDSLLYFALSDSSYGNELWITDGIAENTKILFDVNTGSSSSNPQNLIGTEQFIFFTALDSLHGREIWKTRGTTETTHLVSDIYKSGNGIPENNEFIVVDENIYFTGYNDMFGIELWKSNGYDSTTQVLANINPSSHSYPNSFCEYNKEIYFAAYDGDQWNIWRSRENGVDVQPLRGLNSHGSMSPQWITYCNGIIYFVASDGHSGQELWKYKLIEEVEIESEITSIFNISETDSINYIGTVCSNCNRKKAAQADTVILKGIFYPLDATDTTLTWTIDKGNHIASISSSGLLLLQPEFSENDTVSIRLKTDDGSKLFRTMDIISRPMEIGTLNADAGNDTIFCASNLDEITIGGKPTAAGGTPPYEYSWSCELRIRNHVFYTTSFLNDTAVANPSFKGIHDTLKFHLRVTDSLDAIAEDSVTVIFSDFIFCLGECIEYINEGDSVQLHHCIDGGIPPYIYNWMPSENLSDPAIPNPWAKPATTTTYDLTLTDSAGCKASGSCQVTIITDGINNKISEKKSITITEEYDLVVVDLMDLNTSDSEFRIYNTNGSLVGAFRLNGEKKLDISRQFVPGIYIYSFQNKEVFLSGRFSISNH